MFYAVTIEDKAGETINIGKEGVSNEKNIIMGIDIKIDTIDDDVRNKSVAMLAKVVIRGEIKSEINDELKQIFQWAYESSEEKWYRTIKILVKSSEGNILRTYILKNVFVVDYKEFYKTDGTNEKSVFELFLTQQENNLNTIDTY